MLSKKQAKLDEIDKILREEITPQLEKRRAESAKYKQWQHNAQVCGLNSVVLGG